MLKGHQKDVEAVQAPMPGAEGASIQWLIAKPEGAKNFFMRRIIIKPGAKVPEHSHPEEHEIYILTGRGEAACDGEKAAMEPGAFLFVPGGKPHSFANTGDSELTFICCINNVEG